MKNRQPVELLAYFVKYTDEKAYEQFASFYCKYADDIDTAVKQVPVQEGGWKLSRVVHLGTNLIIWNPMAGLLREDLKWLPLRPSIQSQG
jgi:hypothetical protein